MKAHWCDTVSFIEDIIRAALLGKKKLTPDLSGPKPKLGQREEPVSTCLTQTD